MASQLSGAWCAASHPGDGRRAVVMPECWSGLRLETAGICRRRTRKVSGPVVSDEGGSVFGQLGRRGLAGRMHEQLDGLLAARDQMEQVLGLIVEIGSDLDLDATLQRIVHAAMGLTGARYGALGVRAADGTLASFHHVGMDADAVQPDRASAGR